MHASEQDRGGDDQAATRLRPFLLRKQVRFFELSQDAAAAFEVARASVGQANGACRALEQPYPEARLQIGD